MVMINELPSIVGRQIQKARISKGWTQGELSKASMIPQGTISRYENAERRGIHPENLIRIAEATGVTVDYLLGRYEMAGIAERICRARALKSLSQQDIADALGLSLGAYKKYETAGDQDINLSRISEIADITGVTVSFLLGTDL